MTKRARRRRAKLELQLQHLEVTLRPRSEAQLRAFSSRNLPQLLRELIDQVEDVGGAFGSA